MTARVNMLSFRPIYIVSRIFGQRPFSIAYNANGEIDRPVIHRLDGVWFALSTSISIVSISEVYYVFTSFDEYHESAISFVGDIFITGISRVPGLLATFLDMYYRFELICIFKKITAFDKRASSNFSILET